MPDERATDTTEWLQSAVREYFRYHAVYNEEATEVIPARSAAHCGGGTFAGNLQPEVEILHPYPDVLFESKHIRGKNRVR